MAKAKQPATKTKGKADKTDKTDKTEPVAEAAPPLAAPTTATTASLAIARTIELDPEDYVWATWRKRTPLKKPQPAPFDFESCRKRLAKIKKSSYGWVDWSHADLADHLTRQEAHFWFLAMTDDLEKHTPAEIADKMKEKDITGQIEVDVAIKRMKNCKRFQPTYAIRALFNLFDGPD